MVNILIPYAKQSIDEDDIEAVCNVLRSDWITTGPKVKEFEKAVADFIGVKYAVAFNSGTSALHSAMFALNIGYGDEVILSPITFAATANCIILQGATPVFADVDPDTLLIEPRKVEEKINKNTKAIIAVDYAGQPCKYDQLIEIKNKYNISLVADSCHALGARYKGKKIGSIADMTIFSFHPVKHITTGEGGMIVSDKKEIIKQARLFRNHGINIDFEEREKKNTWYYDIQNVGCNYRINDIQCALGISQLKKLPSFLKRRSSIAQIYNTAFKNIDKIKPLKVRSEIVHAYHLYVIRLINLDRSKIFSYLRKQGIGVNVHYIPLHLHSYFKKRFNYDYGLCMCAEDAYETLITLPMFPRLTDKDVNYIIQVLLECV